MWIAPSVPELYSSNIWTDLKRAFQHAIHTGHVEKREHPTRMLLMPGGGQITVRSATEGIRGAGLDGVILDEAALVDVVIWEEVVRPALVDKQGWAMFFSTPKGLNWFYRLFNRKAPGWESWHLPSSDNPLIPPEELEAAELDMGPRAFNQEHLAQFLEIQGALWPAEYFHDHIWTDELPDAFEATVVTLDPSMGASEKSDFQAVIFAGLSGGKIWIDCLILRLPPLELVAAVDRFARRYNADRVGVEANGFQAVLEPLFNLYAERERMPPLPIVLITNTINKTERIKRIDPYLANRQLRFLQNGHCNTLVDQLIMFPQDKFDDGPDALEMAIRLLREVATGGNAPVPTMVMA